MRSVGFRWAERASEGFPKGVLLHFDSQDMEVDGMVPWKTTFLYKGKVECPLPSDVFIGVPSLLDIRMQAPRTGLEEWNVCDESKE